MNIKRWKKLLEYINKYRFYKNSNQIKARKPIDYKQKKKIVQMIINLYLMTNILTFIFL